MKKQICFGFIVLILAALACDFSFSTASITDANMAKDPDGSQLTTVFAQDETFYAVGEMANAPDDTKIKAVWTAVEADGLESNVVLGEKELTGSISNFNFSYSNADGQLWPVGKYKVDLYLNDELDRTLEFEVEGEVVAQEPTATPEPTNTPEPEPTATPEPTEEVESSAGDSLSSGGDTIATQPTEEPEFESLPFEPEPYVHPSGAFTFVVPQGWEVTEEDETSVAFGDENSVVGVVFVDGEVVYDEAQMQTFIDAFTESFIGTFADEYEVLVQEVQPDDSIYVGTVYSSADGNGDVDFFYEQRDTVVFVLYFATIIYEEMNPTWNEIIASYAVDSQAARASLPEPTPTLVPPTPTQPPAPPPTATPQPVADPLAPQPGRSRVYVFNEFREEVTIDIAGQAYKVPPGTPADGIFIDLDPGKYTYTLSIPGGAAGGEVDLGPNQTWGFGVRGDGAVYNPSQIYP